MVPKRIFIGSASESKVLAKAIAQQLAADGYAPVRWWEEFPPGAVTLDRLLELARSVEGAVFLCTSVDKSWYHDQLHDTPRDNLLFEYGMFVATLGRHKTVAVVDHNTKMPSDCAAITHSLVTPDISSLAERIVAHFDAVFAERIRTPFDESLLVTDLTLVEDFLKVLPPKDWHQRSLYTGFGGAQRWLAMGATPDYQTKKEARELNNLFLEAIRDLDVRTFVSLGPGDAESDKEIALHLRKREPSLRYIPVDISYGLVQRAMARLCNYVSVPVAILGDFEDRMAFIDREIRRHGIKPILFGLLGNTLGNVDRFERVFLQELRSLLDNGDSLLLSVSILMPEWRFEEDRRFHHGSYSVENRHFIAHGLAKHTGESASDIFLDFEDRIHFQEGGSDVPDAVAIDIVDSRSGRLITSIRRYRWEILLSWLSAELNFKVRFSKAVDFNSRLGYGVALLSTR
jgi:hypothetical protein